MIKDINFVKKIQEEMTYIPHLNLSKYLPQPPLREMIKELLQFDESDFYPYITGFQDEAARKHMADNWKGMCIIDACTSGKHNIDYLCTENNYEELNFNFDEQGNPLYGPTDVGELVPTIVNFLYKIAEKPGKTRISRMVANGGNPSWHSHRVLADGGDEKFVSKELLKYVLHIPLITNSKAVMGVAVDHPLQNPDIHRYWQKYNAGEVWIFNSYWYHNVFNLGEYHRDHIMMYVNVDDEKLIPAIDQAIKDYQGPYIPKDAVLK